MNEGAIEPLNVIVFGEGEEDLVTDDRERQQEHGAARHCQGEGAQVQSAYGNTQKYKYSHTETCIHNHYKVIPQMYVCVFSFISDYIVNPRLFKD